MNVLEKLKSFVSKKLLAAILVPVLMGLNSHFGSPLNEESVSNIAYTIIAYIIGQSVVDLANAKNGK